MKNVLHKLKLLLNRKITKNFKLWEILVIILVPILLFIISGIIVDIIYYLLLFIIFIVYTLFMNMPPQNPML